MLMCNGAPKVRWGAASADSLVRGKKLRVELLVYLCHFLTGEAAGGGEIGDRFEVVIVSTRQAPVEHAPCRVADVLETVHDVARDEDEGAGANRRGLATDSHLIGALDDEKYFFLVEMDVVSRAFTGFQPPHEDRDSAAAGLGGEEYFHVEAEGLDRKRLFGLDDDGLQR
jgi:hypothetical protein